MGALSDRCPECGKFVAKGAAVCPHCEAELPEVVAPADPAPAPTGVESVSGGSAGIGRVLGGAVFGAILAVIALTAGAGDVGTLSDGPRAPRDGAAIMGDAEPSTQPQPPQTPSTDAEPSGPARPESALSPERRSELRATIAAIRAELADWPERYQIGRSDLAKVRSHLSELEQLIAEIPIRKE